MGFSSVEMVVERISSSALADKSSDPGCRAIRGMRRPLPDDLDGIIEVENMSYTNPWTGSMLKSSLIDPKSLNFITVDQTGNKIVGFILNLLIMDELHVLNIAVIPSYRRSGIGSSLMETSIKTAEQLGVNAFFLEVRRSNVSALTLYIKQGFSVIGVRRGYYSDNREDALVMKKSI